MRAKALQYAVVLMVPLLLSFANTAGAGMGASSSNDMAITAMVREKLQHDNHLLGSNIAVETKNGEVTLKGMVNSQSDLIRAGKLARYVDGVKQVDNRLSTVNSHHYGAIAPIPGCQIGANWQC
jgi:hyperosmotically inducible protein